MTSEHLLSDNSFRLCRKVLHVPCSCPWFFFSCLGLILSFAVFSLNVHSCQVVPSLPPLFSCELAGCCRLWELPSTVILSASYELGSVELGGLAFISGFSPYEGLFLCLLLFDVACVDPQPLGSSEDVTACSSLFSSAIGHRIS